MFIKLVRIGKDAEVRRTPNNTAVISLSCVYDIGWGDNKKSQWIEAQIWGKQAESLAPYLTKGKQIVIYSDDLHLDTYEHNGKTGAKLKCRVINIDLTSGGSQEKSQEKSPKQESYSADFDDDMPF